MRRSKIRIDCSWSTRWLEMHLCISYLRDSRADRQHYTKLLASKRRITPQKL
ncbi:UNVERIFIED_CONTAM: hypothetical protein RMT77_000440 [Armadillidium vulgare]